MKLDGSRTKVASEEMIERGTATLGDPTHGVVVGDWFYYIANSGWNVLDEHGDVNAGERLTPGRVMRYRFANGMKSAPGVRGFPPMPASWMGHQNCA
jgi:hypothetical protein